MAITQLEWLNQNRHRNYPLADDATGADSTGRTLPTSFLCDMAIDVPPLDALDTGVFYISELTNLGETFQVCINHSNVTGTTLFRSAPIRYDFVALDDEDIDNSRVALYATQEAITAYQDMEQASGEIIVGSCRGIREIAGITLDSISGKLSPYVARHGYAGLSRLIVVDASGVEHVITGDATLVAGSGISLAVGTGNSITIQYAPTEEEAAQQAEEDAGYRDVVEALNALYQLLGVPITNINGISPDDEGNFYMVGLDCTDVQTVTNGLTISNPCSQPCCPPNTPADVSAALKSLEDAKNRLINYHEALLNNLHTMQSRLASLIASKG